MEGHTSPIHEFRGIFTPFNSCREVMNFMNAIALVDEKRCK